MGEWEGGGKRIKTGDLREYKRQKDKTGPRDGGTCWNRGN